MSFLPFEHTTEYKMRDLSAQINRDRVEWRRHRLWGEEWFEDIKGACTYEVCKIVGFFDPVSLCHCHTHATYQYTRLVLEYPSVDIICTCPLRDPWNCQITNFSTYSLAISSDRQYQLSQSLRNHMLQRASASHPPSTCSPSSQIDIKAQ